MAPGGEVFPQEAAFQQEGTEGGEAGQDGHAEEHAGDAEKAPAHQDRHDDPETGEPRLIPQDLGADDVAVHLLQRQHEKGEVQGLQGAVQQDEEDAGDGPQEGAEEGDHIGDAHDDADKGGIGEVQQRAADEADKADDEGVQDLSPDEAGEDLIHPPHRPEDPRGVPVGGEGIDGPAGVGGAAFLGGKEVDGDNDAHDQVHEEAQGGDDAAGDRRHKRLGVGKDLLRQQAQQIIVIPCEAV